MSLSDALALLEEAVLSKHSHSIESLVHILHRCRKERKPQYARRLLACIRKSGLESHASLGVYLVPMLAEAGIMCDAQRIFDMLCDKNEDVWNALIAGYARDGQLERALALYHTMQEKSMRSSSHTFVPVLSACAKLKDLAKGQEIYGEVARMGLEGEVHVGSTLVDMYVKCDMPCKAQVVFDKLKVRNVISWNSLIAGYSSQGLGAEALRCFERMGLDGIPPTSTTFVCSLKACGSLGATDKGQDIHTQIRKHGLEGDLFVGSALVDMYANFGDIAKAQAAFEKMAVRDVVAWTSLIRGYAQHGQGEKAVQGYKQMQLEGISPSNHTLICNLKACGSLGYIDKGQELHATIVGKFSDLNLFVGSALIDMYANFGLFPKSLELLDSLQIKDVALWNALIAGYVKYGYGEDALVCYGKMKAKGVSPNIATFASTLKACSSIGALDHGLDIHTEAQREGLATDVVVGSALVDMYANCGLLVKAQESFDKLSTRNAVSWNALISGYLKQNANMEALHCFDEMQRAGFPPDIITLVCCLKACGRLGAVDKGREIHDATVRESLDKHLILGSTLVDMYANCGVLFKAQEVFDLLPIRDVALWNALLVGYSQLGECDKAFEAFDRMRGEGQIPSVASYISVLNACSHAGLVEKGYTFFKLIREESNLAPTLEHHGCLADIFGRAGQVEAALAVIIMMPLQPGLVVWHTLLGAFRKWRHAELGKESFKQATELDKRDSSAYIYVLNILSDADTQEDAECVEALRLKIALVSG